MRFHENTRGRVLSGIFVEKRLAFVCKKWYLVSQRNALDTSSAFRLHPWKAGGFVRSVLELLFSSFTFLSFTLPAREGKSGGPTCTGRRFLLPCLGILHENAIFALAKMSSLWVAQPVESEYNTGRAGFPAAPPAPAGRAPAPFRAGRGFLQAPCFSKDQQSKAVRVKCRINGELCCGRRRSFPAVRSLHPAAAWTWARAAVTAGARCERCRISRPSFMRFHRMGRAVFCPPRLDSEKEALP